MPETQAPYRPTHQSVVLLLHPRRNIAIVFARCLVSLATLTSCLYLLYRVGCWLVLKGLHVAR